MSRRRGDGGGVSSLEMLLDTMCNTFGSLIFMAVLLAIINQRVSHTVQSRAQPGISQAEADGQVARITELQATVSGLRQTLQQLAELESRTTEIKPQDLTEALRRRQDRLAQLEQRLKETEAQRAPVKDEAAELQKQVAETKDKIKQAEDNPGPAAQRTFSVPSLHAVNREQKLTCVLKAGRLYRIFDTQRSWHEAHVEVAKSGEVFAVTLKEGAGIPIGPEGLDKALAEVLALDPAKAMVMLHVAPDSFAEFQLVKRVVVDRGFEYDWAPWEGALVFKPSWDPLYGQ